MTCVDFAKVISIERNVLDFQPSNKKASDGSSTINSQKS